MFPFCKDVPLNHMFCVPAKPEKPKEEEEEEETTPIGLYLMKNIKFILNIRFILDFFEYVILRIIINGSLRFELLKKCLA